MESSVEDPQWAFIQDPAVPTKEEGVDPSIPPLESGFQSGHPSEEPTPPQKKTKKQKMGEGRSEREIQQNTPRGWVIKGKEIHQSIPQKGVFDGNYHIRTPLKRDLRGNSIRKSSVTKLGFSLAAEKRGAHGRPI